MASRDYIKHTVANVAPPGSRAGDEYYNPTTNILYKDLVANGSSPGFNQVVFVNNSDTAIVNGSLTVDGSTTPRAIILAGQVGNATLDSSGARLAFSRPSTSYIDATNLLGALSFGTGGASNRMTIDATGLVGVAGNIQAGNLRTVGLISATGNVSGNYFIGNGSQLTGVVAGSPTSIVNGTSNIVAGASANITVGVAGTSNVVVFSSTGEYVTGAISATGVITAGAGFNVRSNATTSFSSPLAWTSNSFDIYTANAQAVALTLNADAGTPTNGEKIMFRFKDNGTPQTLTWTTGTANSFRPIGVTLPTTTVANKTVYVGCIYNISDSRWDAVAVAQEA